MSWDCSCYRARIRDEDWPGAYNVCPLCGRTRDQVRLLDGVDLLLRRIDEGEALEPGHHLLHSLRDAVLSYRGGPLDSDEDVPAPAPERRATSVVEPPSEENQLVFRDVPTVAVDLVVSAGVSAEDRQLALERGHRLWVSDRNGTGFYIIAEDETRVVLRELGRSDLHNTYVRREELVRDYAPRNEEP